MTPIHAHMPVELIIGEGVLAACGEKAAKYGKRCLIMTSGSAAEKSGALAASLHALCGGALPRILQTLVDAPASMSEDQLRTYTVRFADLPHYAHVPGGFDGERAIALCRRLFG